MRTPDNNITELDDCLITSKKRPIANKYEQRARELIAAADVQINGDRPWDIQVHNSKLYQRTFARGSIGLGEAYMDGWWDCEQLDELFYRLFAIGIEGKITDWRSIWLTLQAKIINPQNTRRAFKVGRQHYDIGTDLYERMLDKRMIYSCGYWDNAIDLNAAQEAKLTLIAEKLGLESGMQVLDIGCGWGGAAAFFAEHYGVKVTGITISEGQAIHARRLCRDLPVDILMKDYRDIEGRYDRIYSVGMFEHVGYRNYAAYMEIVRCCLVDDGLFLLHTIGCNDSATHTDPWIERYIFPNSMTPSAVQISSATERRYVLEDWHNFGPDYDTTLLAWYQNINACWQQLKGAYDERFQRMWNYYLLSSAGAFRARNLQVWQLVLSPKGIPGGYKAPR